MAGRTRHVFVRVHTGRSQHLLIMSLAELDFIPTATNIVFIGPTGVGKSGLATGLLLKALQNGHLALIIKA